MASMNLHMLSHRFAHDFARPSLCEVIAWYPHDDEAAPMLQDFG